MPSLERRTSGRVPVAIRAGLADARGGALRFVHVTDLSAGGVLVESPDVTLPLARESLVEIDLPHAGVLRAHVVETRREPASGGSGLRVGLRFLDPPRRAAAGPPSGAAEVMPGPAGRRPRSVARAELLHLGAAAAGRAIVVPDEPVPDALAGWLARLAQELGGPPPPSTPTSSALMDAVADLWERQ